jgi:hypothetical protein
MLFLFGRRAASALRNGVKEETKKTCYRCLQKKEVEEDNYPKASSTHVKEKK